MASANKDDGLKALNIAHRAYDAQDLDKARRFADKASRLLSDEEVFVLLLYAVKYMW